MGALGTGNSAALEQAVLEEIEDSLQGMGDSRISDQALEHVQTRLTDQGLVIEIFARPGAPLFTDEDTLQPWLVAFSRVMAELFGTVTNSVAIGAYVRAEPIVIARETIWDRSTAQAHILRQQLQEAGLDAQRFRRVTGHADRSPATSDPMAVRNDRLEIVLLRTGQ